MSFSITLVRMDGILSAEPLMYCTNSHNFTQSPSPPLVMTSTLNTGGAWLAYDHNHHFIALSGVQISVSS